MVEAIHFDVLQADRKKMDRSKVKERYHITRSSKFSWNVFDSLTGIPVYNEEGDKIEFFIDADVAQECAERLNKSEQES